MTHGPTYVRRAREVYRNIRTELRIGSRRAEVSSTRDTVPPVRGAPVRTTVLARSPCSSPAGDGGGAGSAAAAAGRRRFHRNRTVAEGNLLRRRRNNGREDIGHSRHMRRRRWSTGRNLARSCKPPDRFPPAGTCPLKNKHPI